ncbi:LIM domain-binding protein 3 [Frankliniella fusca]|uniref:LIM domain-binding protein 3 n=1 Tax=Frankliniella fusca TaxID=407009 RepID=A0AAE1L737_9NEOP|nr:LIM domain-binding protein 3 [Frankliniella fusca]
MSFSPGTSHARGRGSGVRSFWASCAYVYDSGSHHSVASRARCADHENGFCDTTHLVREAVAEVGGERPRGPGVPPAQRAGGGAHLGLRQGLGDVQQGGAVRGGRHGRVHDGHELGLVELHQAGGGGRGGAQPWQRYDGHVPQRGGQPAQVLHRVAQRARVPQHAVRDGGRARARPQRHGGVLVQHRALQRRHHQAHLRNRFKRVSVRSSQAKCNALLFPLLLGHSLGLVEVGVGEGHVAGGPADPQGDVRQRVRGVNAREEPAARTARRHHPAAALVEGGPHQAAVGGVAQSPRGRHGHLVPHAHRQRPGERDVDLLAVDLDGARDLPEDMTPLVYSRPSWPRPRPRPRPQPRPRPRPRSRPQLTLVLTPLTRPYTLTLGSTTMSLAWTTISSTASSASRVMSVEVSKVSPSSTSSCTSYESTRNPVEVDPGDNTTGAKVPVDTPGAKDPVDTPGTEVPADTPGTEVSADTPGTEVPADTSGTEAALTTRGPAQKERQRPHQTDFRYNGNCETPIPTDTVQMPIQNNTEEVTTNRRNRSSLLRAGRPWRHPRLAGAVLGDTPERTGQCSPGDSADMKRQSAFLTAAVGVVCACAIILAPAASSPVPEGSSPAPAASSSPAPAASSPAPEASSSPAPAASSSPAPAASSPAPEASSSPAPAASSSPALAASSPVPAASSPVPAASSPAPAASSSPAPQPADATSVTEPTTTPEDDDNCYDDFEYTNNPELLERLKKYNVAKASQAETLNLCSEQTPQQHVLEGLGGAPGKVNATWRDRKDVPESAAVLEEGAQHLADNTNSSYWLYQYASTDYETFIRLEHGLLRAKGTADEHVDVRGEVWWSPEEGLCGALRHAKYRQDDRGGLVAEVLQAHCNIFRKSKELVCYGPDSENPCGFCISSVSGALIASLVG